MISAALILPEQQLSYGFNHDIGYELYKIINNPSSNKPMQEAPAATLVSPSGSNGSFGSFGKFPREIRDKIYGYLLISPLLGDSETGCQTWHPELGIWKFVKYQLSTSILFTCSSISKEALKILYESNEFCLSCFNRDTVSWSGSYRIQTPILRFPPADSGYDRDNYIMRDPAVVVALGRVPRWKILVSTLDKPQYDYRKQVLSSWALIDLCKIMNDSCPQSIEVLVIPKNIEGVEGHFDCTYRNIQEALRPFTLLRDLPQGTLHFRDAKNLEVNPQFIDFQVDLWSGTPVGPISSQLPDSVSLRELIHLTESKKPVEYAANMFAGLLQYAQGFERFEPFRLEMGKVHYYRLLKEMVSSRYRYYFHGGFNNPFKHAREHPVERTLWEAKAASDSEDLTVFKKLRALIITYLEPQYQRLLSIYTQLGEFLESNTLYCGFLHQTSCEMIWFDSNLAAEATILMEQFARAFVRDVPLDNQIEIKKQNRNFARHYWDQNREGALADMAKALDRDDGHYFGHFFRTGFRDMEGQFLKIRQARKALFEFDTLGDHGLEIDLGLERDDTAVSLSVKHPCVLHEDDD